MAVGGGGTESRCITAFLLCPQLCLYTVYSGDLALGECTLLSRTEITSNALQMTSVVTLWFCVG